MMTTLTAIAVGTVRAWTRLYTWSMPEAARLARRAEIESDLWEFEHDGAGRGHNLSAPLHLLLRLVLGIPDDLYWRTIHASFPEKVVRGVALGTAALAIVMMWLFIALPDKLPTPPPIMAFTPAPPPPPPPIPPPPPPPRRGAR